MATTTLKVSGMSCGHCVMAVTSALRNVAGVQDAKVDLVSGRAVVQYDESKASARELVGAVLDEGYSAEESA